VESCDDKSKPAANVRNRATDAKHSTSGALEQVASFVPRLSRSRLARTTQASSFDSARLLRSLVGIEQRVLRGHRETSK
jgi:hypothetical protein